MPTPTIMLSSHYNSPNHLLLEKTIKLTYEIFSPHSISSFATNSVHNTSNEHHIYQKLSQMVNSSPQVTYRYPFKSLTKVQTD